MIERLASTRRQDRALHGLTKAFYVLGALVLYPLWSLGSRLFGPLVRLLEGRAERAPAPSTPSQEGDRSMAAVLAELQAVPQTPRPSRVSATARKGIVDVSVMLMTQRRDAAHFGYAYPRQFSEQLIRSADGTPISAIVGMQPTPRPGLVVVHGLFGTKHFDYVRDVAVRAFYDWGFSVSAIDLRGFGMTEVMSEARNTGGWKEGEDVLAAAGDLHERGATSVGALGFSLGASSVMDACDLEGAEQALDGGILAVGGPSDTHLAVEHISTEPPPGDPFRLFYPSFKRLLRSKVRALGWPEDLDDFRHVLDRMTAPSYGISVAELHERSSAKNHVAGSKVPLLVLHATDDEIVPVEHARLVAEAARDNLEVEVWILPWGGHCAFDVLDPRWTWTVYRRFFERLAHYAPPESLVYSVPGNGQPREGVRAPAV